MGRILNREEKRLTKDLWKQIFTEDTDEFLDYYYSEKLESNEILGSFHQEELVSMLHCNPYTLCIGKQRIHSDYIVAVATQKEYRHQGRMAELLCQAMEKAAEEKKPFVFLMPAQEIIYQPFDFVTVYERKDYRLTEKILSECLPDTAAVQEKVVIEELTQDTPERETLIEELIKYSQATLENHYVLFAKRDYPYYLRTLKEQKSQQGSILLVKDRISGAVCGYAFLTKEGEVKLRELVCDEDKEAGVLTALWKTYGSLKGLEILGGNFTRVSLPIEQRLPCIMIRITDFVKFAGLFPLQKAQQQWIENHPVIQVTDCFLAKNQGVYALRLEDRENEIFVKAEKLWVSGKDIRDIPVFDMEEITKKSFKNLKIFLNEVV